MTIHMEVCRAWRHNARMMERDGALEGVGRHVKHADENKRSA